MSGSVSQHVWVAGIQLRDLIRATRPGYYSVNRTQEGAESAVLDWYCGAMRLDRAAVTFADLDLNPKVESFYCHYMPVGE